MDNAAVNEVYRSRMEAITDIIDNCEMGCAGTLSAIRIIAYEPVKITEPDSREEVHIVSEKGSIAEDRKDLVNHISEVLDRYRDIAPKGDFAPEPLVRDTLTSIGVEVAAFNERWNLGEK